MINWLKWLFPSIKKLIEENQELHDNQWKMEQRERRLEDDNFRLTDRNAELRSQLDQRTMELADYIAAMSKLPPIRNPHEWLAKQAELALESQKIHANTARNQQDLIEQAKRRIDAVRAAEQETLSQIPAVLDQQFKDFQKQRAEYLQNSDFFENEIKSVAPGAIGAIGVTDGL